MAEWYQITHKQTKESQAVNTLEGVDLDAHTTILIRNGRPPEQYEYVGDDGIIKQDTQAKVEHVARGRFELMSREELLDYLAEVDRRLSKLEG